MGNADGPALKSLLEGLSKAKKATRVAPVGERLEACTQCIERTRKRLEKSDLELQKIQAERARLAAEVAEGKFDWKHFAQKRDRRPPLSSAHGCWAVQVVIDDFLRRSQWKGSRPVGSTGVVEGTMIPMDVGTLVDNRSARMEAMIDEAGNKRLRVEGASSSVC